MCFGGSAPKATTPAAAPAPALEPAKTPEIGDARRRESEQLFGKEAPEYRVNRHKIGGKPVNPDNPITM